MEKSEVGKVMDTIMSIPGMNEMVKIDFKISRKNALLLSSVIERGLDGKNDNGIGGLVESMLPEHLQELRDISKDCLSKAGLLELSEHLKLLKAK
jgi:hypothetical protein